MNSLIHFWTLLMMRGCSIGQPEPRLGLVSTEPERTLMLPLPTVKVGQRAYLESDLWLFFAFPFTVCSPLR